MSLNKKFDELDKKMDGVREAQIRHSEQAISIQSDVAEIKEATALILQKKAPRWDKGAWQAEILSKVFLAVIIFVATGGVGMLLFK